MTYTHIVRPFYIDNELHIISIHTPFSLKISKNLIMCAFFEILGMGLSNEKIFW